MLKNVHAAGSDGIPPELLKCALGLVSRTLHTLFIQVWRSGIVPADWQEGIIITLYKGKGPRTLCSNYGPITLLSVLSSAQHSLMLCWHAYNLLSTSLMVLSNQELPLADQPLTPSLLCVSCHSYIVNLTDDRTLHSWTLSLLSTPVDHTALWKALCSKDMSDI